MRSSAMSTNKRNARRGGASLHSHHALPVPLTLLILFLSNAAHPARAAAPACLAPPSGLVGWWPGDSNENDTVGKNNPSTVSLVSLVPAEVLDGFSFGTKGYI